VKREWLALIFAMTFPTAVALGYFMLLSTPIADAGTTSAPPPAQGNAAMQAAYSASKVVQFAFPVAYLAAIGVTVRPRRPSFAGLAWGIGFGLLVAALILGIYFSPVNQLFLTSSTREMVRQKVAEMTGGVTPLRYFALAAFISVAHSLLEEYYWRWFVFGRLRTLVPVAAAAILSSLAFMGHHVIVLDVYLPGRFWTATMPLSLGIAVGGVAWCWIFHKTGSIYSSWISHLIVDVAIMALGYDLLFS
jgi:membrane protease YdiL (CAAX protease family)